MYIHIHIYMFVPGAYMGCGHGNSFLYVCVRRKGEVWGGVEGVSWCGVGCDWVVCVCVCDTQID